jgi:hypothetical protein
MLDSGKMSFQAALIYYPRLLMFPACISGQLQDSSHSTYRQHNVRIVYNSEVMPTHMINYLSHLHKHLKPAFLSSEQYLLFGPRLHPAIWP